MASIVKRTVLRYSKHRTLTEVLFRPFWLLRVLGVRERLYTFVGHRTTWYRWPEMKVVKDRRLCRELEKNERFVELHPWLQKVNNLKLQRASK